MACDVLDKANQLTRNNKGERRRKISLCKVCFLARNAKQCDRQPGPTLSYTSAREIATLFLYLKPKKSYPFRAEPPHIGHYVELKRAIRHLQNEHTYLMHAHASLYTDVPPPRLFKKLNVWSSF